MLIHNICITGQIEHFTNNFNWRQRNIQFFDNSIVLKKNNYQLCLTKNIRSVLLLPNLKNLFKKRLELEFQQEIINIELKIGNIHHSSRIHFNSRSLLEKFIPQLQEKFKIEECLVTQEQNTPVQTTLANLLQEGYIFLSINLKLLNKTSTVRLQVDRTKVFTHATIILTQFSQKTEELVNFFIEREIQPENV